MTQNTHMTQDRRAQAPLAGSCRHLGLAGCPGHAPLTDGVLALADGSDGDPPCAGLGA